MNHYEWIECKDFKKMAKYITVKDAKYINQAIIDQNLTTTRKNRNTTCIHTWHWCAGHCSGPLFRKKDQDKVCDIVREVIANPFHYQINRCELCGNYCYCKTIEPETNGDETTIYAMHCLVCLDWVTPRITQFAQSIIESGDYSSNEGLADLLEENGCNEDEILHHLRGETECTSPTCYAFEGCDCVAGWTKKPIKCQDGCWAIRVITTQSNTHEFESTHL